MSYRDDRQATAERLAALEREAKRAVRLEQRVRQLEAENRQLRQQLAAQENQPAGQQAPAATSGSPTDETALEQIYVDDKLRDYAAAIVAATYSPADERIERLPGQRVSGVRAEDAKVVIRAARARALDEGRRFVLPTDIRAAARETLPRLIIAAADVDPGMADALIDAILDRVEVP